MVFASNCQLIIDSIWHLHIKMQYFLFFQLWITGKYLNFSYKTTNCLMKMQHMHLRFWIFLLEFFAANITHFASICTRTFRNLVIINCLFHCITLLFLCWSVTTTVWQFPVKSYVRDGRPPETVTLTLNSLTRVTWLQWPPYKSWNSWLSLAKRY